MAHAFMADATCSARSRGMGSPLSIEFTMPWNASVDRYSFIFFLSKTLAAKKSEIFGEGILTSGMVLVSTACNAWNRIFDMQQRFNKG